ncbi:predicted protein [Sclerotinia sclerotiorum 1980 UF-70]|uniref:Uncharacterized protein n=1 Tax=Sclerotinia sclerotiorum (strain ATCC 18683 / 1980 / Ss-1) TaxID=665079 RepID=A7F3E1_SCLS1|nr:predicted protein [Sclerotinia sclerotiorum 1980 UF-70]EDN97262.1 predicted protein [Sclerotinia sclerotiorum 1980 UF-70]
MQILACRREEESTEMKNYDCASISNAVTPPFLSVLASSCYFHLTAFALIINFIIETTVS